MTGTRKTLTVRFASEADEFVVPEVVPRLAFARLPAAAALDAAPHRVYDGLDDGYQRYEHRTDPLRHCQRARALQRQTTASSITTTTPHSPEIKQKGRLWRGGRSAITREASEVE